MSRETRKVWALNVSRWILLLMVLSTGSVVRSYVPENYPIEVYHMLQERSQYGIGRDNRIRGSWGPWSSWSECSRPCGTGVQSQARECTPPRGLRKRSLLNKVNATSPKPICIGTHKRYHICNTHECTNYSGDPRTEQCAKYNNKMYKGQSYNWVPFLNAPNPCALNCRAVGQRFYATLESEVINGTPCDGPNLRGRSTGLTIDHTEQWLCVAGQCRPVGCDGVIGSGAIRDTCGVCGGQGRGCKLFEGIFMEPVLPRGHQPITTIPRGAMSLNISELRYTGNFLAMRGENGSYILNGPNSVSPSGIYKTAGTTLKYQRGDKDRMESISAPGPLNESLKIEILFHEMNPGVLYKYMLPAPEEIPEDNAIIAPPLYAPGSGVSKRIDTTLIGTPSISVSGGRQLETTLTRNQVKEESDEYRNAEMKFSPTTVMAGDAPTNIKNASANKKKKKQKKRTFAWRIMELTPCTKSCGGGMQSGIFKCVREETQMIVANGRCRKLVKPDSPRALQCNEHPCPAGWRADAWTECSVTCGTGVKTRRLECIQHLNSKLTVRVAAGACPQPPDLSTVTSCTGPPCPNVQVRQMSHMTSHQRDTTPRWHVGAWSSCSSRCGKGVRNRSVTCITTRQPCPQSTKPADERPCETACNTSQNQTSVWLYSQWSSKCTVQYDHEIETRKIACSDANETLCDEGKKPVVQRQCSKSPEKAKWFTGPWSSCSVQCGEGIAQRDVICIGNSSGESKILYESNCTSPRPHAEEACYMPPCTPEWYMSDWNECSASCNGGIQERIVMCMAEGLETIGCDVKSEPMNRQFCNTQTCAKDSYAHKIPKKVHPADGCVDKYPNCQLVVKAGLCRIKYYKHSCCGCRH
ncbi:ADAMTS-like protein 4 isoform X3 [Fopius arisanus]|uniref:ADAMTS-like protein 4 isoform X3 n=1 Tax=Fopius arisanus TaxID=64838 RepID=A0A9R1SWG2_9HYME|nr:PREDICTED: ADAMTS-like protein 4 isoform X3 [Fopius arisanus]XP_011298338.1 PREDICTED: ADAMTS-like protein 4 isoform X3 [Fopius arisanus]